MIIHGRWLALLMCLVLAAPAARGEDDPRDLYILRQLGEPTLCDFVQTPLKDIAEYFADLHRVSIYLDTEAFEKAGVMYKNLGFTKKIADVPLWKCLEAILKEHKLSFMIKEHLLTVTTAEVAKDWQAKNIDQSK